MNVQNGLDLEQKELEKKLLSLTQFDDLSSIIDLTDSDTEEEYEECKDKTNKVKIFEELQQRNNIKKSININLQIREGIKNRNIPNKTQSVDDLIDDIEMKNIKYMLYHVWDSSNKMTQCVKKNECYRLIKTIDAGSISIHKYYEFVQASLVNVPKTLMKINLNEIWEPFGEYHLVCYVKNRPANPFYKIKRITYDLIQYTCEIQNTCEIDATKNEYSKSPGDNRSMWSNKYTN